MKTTTETKNYISCERCEKNNWDNPEFWGCPRGGCEVEAEGPFIVTKTSLVDEIYRLESSWGILLTDKEGNVIGHENLYESDDEEENYLLNIEKVDVEEYLTYMRSRGWKDINYDDEDILFFGFWRKDGVYEPADKKWREEIVISNN